MTAGPEGECLRRATHDRSRDRSWMAETPFGSVHESPVRGQRTRATLKADAASLECIAENFCEANAGMGNCISFSGTTRAVAEPSALVPVIPTKTRLNAGSM